MLGCVVKQYRPEIYEACRRIAVKGYRLEFCGERVSLIRSIRAQRDPNLRFRIRRPALSLPPRETGSIADTVFIF